MNVRNRSVLFGVVASLLLLGLYFLIMSIGSGSFEFAKSELLHLKYWISALVIIFGVQVGLFSLLKSCNKSDPASAGSTALGGTTSTVAMLACCAHHLTDILPILGLSAASLFLARYQEWLLGFGILSNVVGILVMFRKFKSLHFV